MVVFADSLENHNKRLKEVFDRLSKHTLTFQPDKREFLRKEIIYLGHVKSVFPVSKSPKELKAFLGSAGYYRRFIENFSWILRSLTKLLKKDAEFKWISLQQNSIETLKKLCSPISLLIME